MATPLSFATQLARQTGQLLLEHFNSPNTQTNLKPDGSVVTEADLAADHLIAQAIHNSFPTDFILSEELHPSNDGTAANLWVIDPLDGTTNFSLGLHYWGVLIARLADGWPECAALYFPLLDELYTVQSSQGAYLNGEPIGVKPPNPDQPAAFFACCSRTLNHYNVSVPYKARIFGSAAYSLCAVARGIAVLSFEAKPKIWDIAGAWLLVKEAGGIIQMPDGSQPFPLVPGTNYAMQSFPTVAAATQELATSALSQIRPKEQT